MPNGNYLPPQLNARGPAPWQSTVPRVRPNPATFQPLRSSGSKMNFNEPWHGDAETDSKTLSHASKYIRGHLGQLYFYEHAVEKGGELEKRLEKHVDKLGEHLDTIGGGDGPPSTGSTPDSDAPIGPRRPSGMDPRKRGGTWLGIDRPESPADTLPGYLGGLLHPSATGPHSVAGSVRSAVSSLISPATRTPF